MDEMPGRQVYKCLPLKIANSFGWELLSPCLVEAVWDGGVTHEAVRVTVDKPLGEEPFVESKFGAGLLSFWPGLMIRTDAPAHLFVTGPLNRMKDGIHPLSAVVETNWLPAQLPMNWHFSRPGTRIRFEQGEPYCHIFPVDSSLLHTAEPEWRTLETDTELLQQFEEWRLSRLMSNADSAYKGKRSQFYQHYHQGRYPNGKAAPTIHFGQLRLKEFPSQKQETELPVVPASLLALLWQTLNSDIARNDSDKCPKAVGDNDAKEPFPP